MSASRLALVLVCALLAGGAAAAVPESASSALTISARDDGPGRNAQEDDAEALRIRREEAYRNTRRMRQLPPEVVAALVRGTVEFDDLSFNDDDTVVDDDAVRALKAAAAPPRRAPAHPAIRLGALGFALLLLVGGILLKRQTAGSQDRR